jgi:L-ascorbate metabolism protein UlaG (beta-lactamase superfamily)
MACSYIIEVGGKTIFFAGDTAYHSDFRNIGNTYNVDAALLPIGCYKPQFYMKRFHMDPADAVQAFLDLKAKFMIPIHWGTFRLSLEKPEEPIEWLKKIAAERKIEDQIKILQPGEHLEI